MLEHGVVGAGLGQGQGLEDAHLRSREEVSQDGAVEDGVAGQFEGPVADRAHRAVFVEDRLVFLHQRDHPRLVGELGQGLGEDHVPTGVGQEAVGGADLQAAEFGAGSHLQALKGAAQAGVGGAPQEVVEVGPLLLQDDDGDGEAPRRAPGSHRGDQLEGGAIAAEGDVRVQARQHHPQGAGAVGDHATGRRLQTLGQGAGALQQHGLGDAGDHRLQGGGHVELRLAALRPTGDHVVVEAAQDLTRRHRRPNIGVEGGVPGLVEAGVGRVALAHAHLQVVAEGVDPVGLVLLASEIGLEVVVAVELGSHQP